MDSGQQQSVEEPVSVEEGATSMDQDSEDGALANTAASPRDEEADASPESPAVSEGDDAVSPGLDASNAADGPGTPEGFGEDSPDLDEALGADEDDNSPVSPLVEPESPAADAEADSPPMPDLSDSEDESKDQNQPASPDLGVGTPEADDGDVDSPAFPESPVDDADLDAAGGGEDMDLDAESPMGLGLGSPEAGEEPDLTEDRPEGADDVNDNDDTETPAAAGANNDLMDQAEQSNLIANIFGDSDDDDGDFLGFDVDAVTATKRHHGGEEDSDSDPGVIDGHLRRGHSTAGHASDDDDDDVIDDDGRRVQPSADARSDFEVMMLRKRAGRKKKRKPGDEITGMDDYVRTFIREMRTAAEEDVQLNERQQAATKKLKMLPSVLRCLNQADLMPLFIRQGALSSVAVWLTPLPDGSLPHLTVRDGLITWLCSVPELEPSQLKSSSVGKAIMYLYRHPKETRENRQRTGKLISSWSRLIFGLEANYKLVSRDEREMRDYMHMKRQKQRQSTDGADDEQEKGGLLGESGQALKPGDRGFVGRARVPKASNKDYIVRPKWNVDKEASRKGKKEPDRFEKQQLKHKQGKQLNKTRRAAAVSLVGTKMSL
ncbi:protein IWS1 homolog [Sycon ciliatum]|uniref:protein IWS1 homolog n=2 Tax=Sycon ciliatum TaxID=27933 RepID=UPI0031F67352